MIDSIFNELRKSAEEGKIKENKGTRSCFLIFKEKNFDEVTAALENLLKSKKGEKISCEIKKGEIEDMGMVCFEIKRGKLIEFYDYDMLSACFMRIYEISRKNASDSWIALYIDENTFSPWWSREEREELKK